MVDHKPVFAMTTALEAFKLQTPDWDSRKVMEKGWRTLNSESSRRTVGGNGSVPEPPA